MKNTELKEYLIGELFFPTEQGGWVGNSFHQHITNVLRRLSVQVLKKLISKDLVFFAPDADFWGRALRITISSEQIVVWLSPLLLSESQTQIEWTIAHELAHVALGHEEPGFKNGVAAKQDAQLCEFQADKLARSWRFTLPHNHRSVYPRSTSVKKLR